MRLGKKKEKDRENEREQIVDGVARIICSQKSHHAPLRGKIVSIDRNTRNKFIKKKTHILVYIDGTEWTGVKFFQLSSQWQTHVRNFPIALIGTTSGSD